MTIPAATFLNFLSGLASQGLMQVGAIPNPLSGERSANPDYARYTVQLLDVLRLKTAGNLDAEEQRYLDGMIAELGERLAKLPSEE